MLLFQDSLTFSGFPQIFRIPNKKKLFLDGSMVKNPPAMQQTEESLLQSLIWEDSLEEEYSSILACKIS